MSSMIKGFTKFVREQGVVGLAVGLAIGTKAGDTVSALVENFISPIVKLILQGTDLSHISSDIKLGSATATFGWGNIIQAIIVLLATAFVVYFVVDKAGLTKADKK